MDMKQCENATAVNVNKFTHGYHYVHFNNSFIIDVISKVYKFLVYINAMYLNFRPNASQVETNATFYTTT